MAVKSTHWGDHFTTHTKIKSCCTPENKIMSHVSDTSILKSGRRTLLLHTKKKKNQDPISCFQPYTPENLFFILLILFIVVLPIFFTSGSPSIIHKLMPLLSEQNIWNFFPTDPALAFTLLSSCPLQSHLKFSSTFFLPSQKTQIYLGKIEIEGLRTLGQHSTKDRSII